MGRRADSRVTGFYGEVGCKTYRAALIRQSGTKVFFLSWLDAQGTLIFIDLIGRSTQIFRDVVGGHRTLHVNGQVHSRVEVGDHDTKETLGRTGIWGDFETTIPLDSIPSEAPDHPLWERVDRKIVLRAGDFENAAGVNLIFCLATHRTIPGEQERWDHRWILKGESTIVVGAKRVPYPGQL
jgi:hypothetical protein